MRAGTTVAALLVAGTASGVGKTTVATGLMAALRRRGLRVQPFKVGPDYIDPTHHAAASGRPGRNLDTWLVDPARVAELFWRASAGADLAIVEGVMGLYDGRHGEDGPGSTADVARLLGAPIILVVDAARSSVSVAAAALGFREFGRDLRIVGAIVNNVASEAHLRSVREPLETRAGIPVLGWLPRSERLRQPERYLGLVPTEERPISGDTARALAAAVEDHFDLARIVAAARAATHARAPAETGLFPDGPRPIAVRIAVARDQAFTFHYQDNVDLLRAWGAEVAYFSPLEDDRLPADVAGIYLGGGFPELFAARLASNRPMLDQIRQAAASGMPVYGECGGLIYLARRVIDADGAGHTLAGIVPATASIGRQRVTVGYRSVRARRDSILLREGESLRVHEFHRSDADLPSLEAAAYAVEGPGDRLEGYALGNVLASYMHIHFATRPDLAPRLVDACAAWFRASARPSAPVASTVGSSGPAESNVRARNGRGRPTRGIGHRRTAVGTRPSELCEVDAAAPGLLLRQYGLPPAEIEPLSLARIDDAVRGRLPAAEPVRSLARRLVYAAGDPELADQVLASRGAIEGGVRALAGGACVVVDTAMVAAGVDRRALRQTGGRLRVAVREAEAGDLASRLGITRAAAGMLAIRHGLEGAVVAIGNAPTALLALLDIVQDSGARPALVIGLPVGFVAAAEAKLLLSKSDLPYITIPGTRGGSPLAAAVLNHLLRLALSTPRQADAAQQARTPAPPAGVSFGG